MMHQNAFISIMEIMFSDRGVAVAFWKNFKFTKNSVLCICPKDVIIF